jgi:predicted phage terminase large subunit-like protein
MPKWDVVYEGAYREDNSLYFPEKLNKEILESYRKTMGLYKFTNQYLNQVIPDADQDFKKSWIRHYDSLPQIKNTVIFIDPAISLEDTADYTATVVVDGDPDENWYLRLADRRRETPTQTIDRIFRLYDEYKPIAIGIEEVAYQAALTHFLHEEMRRRKKYLPIKGIKRSTLSTHGVKRDNNSKNFRIRSLVPRFEFGKIYLAPGMDDFILEYTTFPRGRHDDILDALSSVEELMIYPNKPKETSNVRNPNAPGYERQYIEKLLREASRPPTEDGNEGSSEGTFD